MVCVFAIQREQQIADGGAGALVEVAGRLVGEQQLRPVHERAGEGDALLLAARQLVRVVVQALAEADRRQRVAGTSTGIARGLRAPAAA